MSGTAASDGDGLAACLDEALGWDAAGRHHEMLQALLRRSTDPTLIELLITRLWNHRRFAAADYLARALARVGHDSAIGQLARAAQALAGAPAAGEAEIIAALARHCDALDATQRGFLASALLRPLLSQLRQPSDDAARLLRLADMLKACVPDVRAIFDWHAAPQPRRDDGDGSGGGTPIVYRDPPAREARIPYRVVVAVRRHFLGGTAGTRLFDMGPRLVQAARAYGWQALACPLQLGARVAEDCDAIRAACEQFAADILLLDDAAIRDPASFARREPMIAALRRRRPSLRIVALHLDCWVLTPDALRRSAASVDAVWATAPALPVWQDAVFAGKVLQAPFPHALPPQPPGAAPPARISFTGSLLQHNWPRLFWRAAATAHGLPIDWRVSDHADDGLPPLDSYAAYLRRVADGGCAVNFVMRDDFSRIVTGRGFEAMLAGALLLQEEVADFAQFFVAGEHYLPFRSFADLRAACELVTQDPARAQTIRRAGHAFAVARYADDRLLGYLDALLFGA
jgi:hypothetical protein